MYIYIYVCLSPFCVIFCPSGGGGGVLGKIRQGRVLGKIRQGRLLGKICQGRALGKLDGVGPVDNRPSTD